MGYEENIGMPKASVFALRETVLIPETTDDLLRELVEEIRGLRRDLQAREWRRGERLIGRQRVYD